MLLLPPSEAKAQDEVATPPSRRGRSRHEPARRGREHGWDPGSGTFADLAASRRTVVDALAAAGGGDRRLLGVGGDHLLRALSANSQLLGAPVMPAWQRYNGVVWAHLDAATLGAVARRRIVVLSGLFGVVRADDPVPDYRLKMSANLAPLGKLSTWWRADVTAAIAHAARRKVVIDLLPQEHRAAWQPGDGGDDGRDRRPDRVRGVRVTLVDPSGKPGGHFAKAAKGELARAILTDGVGVLDHWHHDRFDLSIDPL